MDYITVFNAFDIALPLYIGIPVGLLALTMGGLFWLNKNKHLSNYLPLRNCGLIIGVFSLAAAILLIVQYVGDLSSMANMQNNPAYGEVEGPVEHFVPRHTRQNNDETFTVDGITFTVDPKNRIGYQKVYALGGHIRREGQRVKISYVREGDQFIILKLSVLKQDLADEGR